MSYKNLNSKNLIFENFPVQTKNVMAQVTYIQDFQIQWMVAQWQLINSTCFKLKFKTIWFFFGQQCIDMSPIFVN